MPMLRSDLTTRKSGSRRNYWPRVTLSYSQSARDRSAGSSEGKGWVAEPFFIFGSTLGIERHEPVEIELPELGKLLVEPVLLDAAPRDLAIGLDAENGILLICQLAQEARPVWVKCDHEWVCALDRAHPFLDDPLRVSGESADMPATLVVLAMAAAVVSGTWDRQARVVCDLIERGERAL